MPKVMATCVISLIPALLVYAFAQKSLLKGIALEGIKK
jgi:ABC-type glycerol-3-phosphate transport system permease component